MKDYSNHSIIEAYTTEITNEFMDNMKRLNPEVTARRIHELMNAAGERITFIELAAQFNALANCKTCAD